MTSAARPTATSDRLDLAEGRELLLAAPQRDGGADELVRRRADRQEVGEVRLAGELERRAGRSSCPWRRTAWTRSGRRCDRLRRRASVAGPIVEAARDAFAGSEGLAASARKTTCVLSRRSRLRATSSSIWKAAAITPVRRAPPSRTGRRDDVVELAAREPDPLGLRALERAGDRRDRREVGRVGKRPVRARERRALGGRRDEEVGAHARAPARASTCRTRSPGRAGRSPGRASTSSRSCRRCSRRRRARGGARRSGSAGTTPSPGPPSSGLRRSWRRPPRARGTPRRRPRRRRRSRIRSAIARKILSVQRELRRLRRRELQAPSAGPPPRSRRGPGVSVPLIVGVGRRRLVVLAVLVLVGLGLEPGHVDADGRAAARRPSRRSEGSTSAAACSCQALSVRAPVGHALEPERSVGPGDGREVRVDDHDEADHLGMDVAVDADEARLLEGLRLARRRCGRGRGRSGWRPRPRRRCGRSGRRWETRRSRSSRRRRRAAGSASTRSSSRPPTAGPRLRRAPPRSRRPSSRRPARSLPSLTRTTRPATVPAGAADADRRNARRTAAPRLPMIFAKNHSIRRRVRPRDALPV